MIWNEWIKTKKLDNQQKDYLNSIFNFINEEFPKLILEIKWNEAMFANNKTFIIALSPFKKHISIAPEKYAIDLYSQLFKENNIQFSSNIFKLNYDEPINFNLLKEIIEFKIKDKMNYSKYFK